MSAPSSSETIEEIPRFRQVRDEASCSRGYRLIRWRLVIENKDDVDDHDSIIQVKPSSKNRESVGEAHPSRTKAFSASGNDSKSIDNDPLPIGVNRGSMPIEKMEELVSRHSMPFSYVYKVLTISEYVSTSGSQEIGVCKETFWARF